jgi:hypothetical protein
MSEDVPLRLRGRDEDRVAVRRELEVRHEPEVVRRELEDSGSGRAQDGAPAGARRERGDDGFCDEVFDDTTADMHILPNINP